MNPRLMSGLPDDHANGLADQGERLIEQPDTVLYVVARLTVGQLVSNLLKKQVTPYLCVAAIDVLGDAEDSEWARNLLDKRGEDRRAAGQLEIELEPGELAELMAEFSEFADDIGQSVDALKADFAEWDEREHGTKRSPEGTDPQTIRGYLAARRLEDGLPAREDIGSLNGRSLDDDLYLAQSVGTDGNEGDDWGDDVRPVEDVPLPADETVGATS